MHTLFFGILKANEWSAEQKSKGSEPKVPIESPSNILQNRDATNFFELAHNPSLGAKVPRVLSLGGKYVFVSAKLDGSCCQEAILGLL